METLSALSDEPDRAYANAQLALTLMTLEAWEMAGQALDHALLLNPRYAEALAYRGLVRDQQGEDGLPDLMRALDLEPDNALVRYALGRHYADAGDYDAARTALIQAASLDPDNPAIIAELGAVYRARGDLAEAATWLRRAAELDSDNIRLWEELAAFYADTGYKLEEEGLSTIHNALAHAPESGDLHASLGWALYQTGQEADARAELEEALALASDNPRALYYDGVLLEVGGDAEGAAEAYRSALDVGAGTRWAALAERGLDRLLLGE
jgi:Flp pilus assembly protein TadD